jgi:ParB family chromosome partitioning protein
MERRLGRGLGSLLGTSAPVDDQKATNDLPLASIQPNPYQPRRTFDPAALEELADSIKRHGILQPIVVRQVSGLAEAPKYQLVSGERRWRASKMAGRTTIPASVRNDIQDEQMLELALVENLQRQDLDAIERATGYQQLIQSLKLSQEQVAERVGLKRATVANHLRLLELPAAAQEAVRKNLISMGHARALLGLSDKAAVMGLVERIARQDLSVREVERIVRQSVPTRAATKAAAEAPVGSAPWVRELEERMRHHLGTKVEVHNSPGFRGQIVIDYFNRSDLDRLCERLAPREELR